MSEEPDTLIERDGPIQALGRAVSDVRGGDGRLLVFEGPAGIGKSRLVAHAAATCDAAGLMVLRARGGELEHEVTFGVARQLFERLLLAEPDDGRAQLLAGSAALGGAALGLALDGVEYSPDSGPVHGLYWLASNLAQRGPIAIVVDDAQWADEESLRFLNYLARRLLGLPVLLIVAARSREHGQESQSLDVLSVEAGSGHLTLHPLSESGVAAVLRSRLGWDLGADLSAACLEVTGGSPFFITEIAEALAADDDGRPVVDRVRELVPPTVMRSIVVRLAREGETSRAVGVALAILDGQASIELVQVLAGVPESAVVEALARLTSVGLCPRDGRPRLAHPIIRSAIYRDVPESRRRQLHRTAARALLARNAAPEDVVPHLLLSEPGGDAVVAETLAESGSQALRRGAADTAMRLFARALAERPLAPVPPRIALQVAEAELRTGAMAAATERLRALISSDAPADVIVHAALMLSPATTELDGEPAAILELEHAVSRVDGDDALRLDAERASLSMNVPGRSVAAMRHMRKYTTLGAATPSERVALAVTSIARAMDVDAQAAEVASITDRALGAGDLVSEQTAESPTVLPDLLQVGFGWRDGARSRQRRDRARRGGAPGQPRRPARPGRAVLEYHDPPLYGRRAPAYRQGRAGADGPRE